MRTNCGGMVTGRVAVAARRLSECASCTAPSLAAFVEHMAKALRA
ncbi:hypothetical protein [Streptomyces sp. NPDC029674]